METRHQIKKQKLEEEKLAKKMKEVKRANSMFVRKDKVIRKNDIITDPLLNKIKLEPQDDFTHVVVKQEIPEEQLPEGMQFEKDLDLVIVDEKVDLSDADKPCCSSALAGTSSSRKDNLPASEEFLEIERLKDLLKHMDVENETLKMTRKKNRLENMKLLKNIDKMKAELECEVKAGASLRLQMKAMKDSRRDRNEGLAAQNKSVIRLTLELSKIKDLLAVKEAELKAETISSNNLRSQVGKLKELLGEKDMEIYHLKKTLQNETMKKESSTFNPPSNEIHGDDLSPEEKVLRHFPDVLKIFIEQQDRENGLINWEKLLPKLKLCRLVCKSWKQSVDIVFEKDSSHVELCAKKNNPADYQRYTPCPFVLTNLEKSTVPWFLKPQQSKKMDNHVPTRHFMLWYNDDHQRNLDWNRYSQIVITYLKQFGTHVWHLTVNMRGFLASDLNKVYTCFRDMLELMPNIQSIAMDVWYKLWSEDTKEDHKLEQISFPHLKKLVTLHCTGDVRLFHMILSSNRHIQKLSFADDCFSRSTPSLMEFDFPHLSEVRYSVNGKDNWNKFINVTWKIEKLILYLSNSEDLCLLESLERFGETLKSLTIDLWFVDPSMLQDIKWKLPQLTSLQIISHSRKEPRNWESFLVQLVSLERFTFEQIQCRFYSVAENTFVEYVNSFHSSSDWTKLLKLKHVSLIVQVDEKRIGKTLQFSVKRSDGRVVRFDLVSIDEKEIIAQ